MKALGGPDAIAASRSNDVNDRVLTGEEGRLVEANQGPFTLRKEFRVLIDRSEQRVQQRCRSWLKVNVFLVLSEEPDFVRRRDFSEQPLPVLVGVVLGGKPE